MSFNFSASTANAVFYRSYSRRQANGFREDWNAVTERTLNALIELGSLDDSEVSLIREMQTQLKTLPSGRWLWVGGSEWAKNPKNFPGSYNCSSTDLIDFKSFGLLMSLAMQGCGTGAVIEPKYIEQLPTIKNVLNVKVIGNPGDVTKENRLIETSVEIYKDRVDLKVGDSRNGWVTAYQSLLELAASEVFESEVSVIVDVSNVRAKGEKLKGFGGTANPIKLSDLFIRVASILNKAVGRKLTSVECCLIMSEAAVTIVAGNIRRSASIMQFDSNDIVASKAKDNLWQQDENGNWRIDPERDALRMGNHTRVFHNKPTFEEVLEAVSKQFYSGEGAIQYAAEAIARSNADLLNTEKRKNQFIADFEQSQQLAAEYLRTLAYKNNIWLDDKELNHRMGRYGLNPCFAAGTMVLTRKGHFPIESLVGQVVEIWDGKRWFEIDNFRVTAENQRVYNVELHNGQTITATKYHKFVLADGTRKQLKDLKAGDKLFSHNLRIHGDHIEKAAYLKGFLIGDGTLRGNKAALDLYHTKFVCKSRLVESASETIKVYANDDQVIKPVDNFRWSEHNDDRHSLLGLNQEESLNDWVTVNRFNFPFETLNWSYESKCDFIAGVMDADGSAMDTENGFAYQLTSIHKDWLLGFQKLLRTIGVKSKLNPVRKGGEKDFGDRGGVCTVQDSYRITISQVNSINLASQVNFTRLVSFAKKKTSYKLASNELKVKSVSFSHVADKVYCCTVSTTHAFALSNGVVIGQCGEITMKDNFCNLSEIHLNQLDPFNFEEQENAFKAGAISAAVLLHHKFTEERYQYSREIDPIVGVSFTGLFDFFVKAFGADWLNWWQAGRPSDWNERNYLDDEDIQYLIEEISPGMCSAFDEPLGYIFKELEKEYLDHWKNIVHQTVKKYCEKHNLRVPNRCTTVQPAGSKSLLTGASSGWHPPKAARYIRRITFAKDDAIALALMDYGYSVVPSQSDKDENGVLLNDPFDPRCTEWLVEIPVSVSWADLPGCDQVDISKFSVEAQYDFYMQVQRFYTRHNTSATLEIRENEIETLAKLIHNSIENNEGYVSAAILARFDSLETFPRLPFEPIRRETYDQLSKEVLLRRKGEDFLQLLNQYDKKEVAAFDQGAAACDSDKCLLPLADPNKSKEPFVFKGFEPVK